MPVNRNALIRYRTLDACLQNRRRKWTLDDLMDACGEALYEYQGINTGVSRRTIQADIEMMRSNKLGYEAPIIVVDKKYYTYSDKNYSITNIPLNQQDIQVLTEVSDLLKQFKGFGHFSDVNEMVSKLEDKIYTQKTQSAPIIDFEKNDNLKGLEWIEVIRKAIVAKKTICITYQSFKAREASTFCFSGYLLKEYRNRWFVLGMQHKRNAHIMNLALDRIQTVEEHDEPYRENKTLDLATYYDDCIGVTKTPGQRDCEVIFWIDRDNAPYVITKPLHHTQKVLNEDATGTIFSIKVILNFELERELLGFGAKMRVLGPRVLVKQIKGQLRKMIDNYDPFNNISSEPQSSNNEMNEKYINETSKFLSMVLRHQPQLIGIELDEHGWANIDELIDKANLHGQHLDSELLNHIVENNSKKRFAFDETSQKIRASQGHSVAVDLGYQPQMPPDVLYHGTGEKSVSSILKSGLEKRSRQHVHLSRDIETAIQVGSRHGKPVVLKISAAEMCKKGFVFYLSENKVWLTNAVPVEFITLSK
ncbi:RNA 2'-phosphotransferase [Mucilaginibacter pallidiroseus]|uniref:Probable RNA 2'-phosphotransferase n=1 Tax=Mucilaginibacter pallidiroseus TaxID=2599295 RepID=A0A563UEZ9_9SPHI|nr:RNA 2'-phosphotransferase [Mucilaginibacter pallidiroseus]TWR29937.1 RNA 2'-phosphotransferase [Mucilaginibacter pallidiroseus]